MVAIKNVIGFQKAHDWKQKSYQLQKFVIIKRAAVNYTNDDGFLFRECLKKSLFKSVWIYPLNHFFE